MRYLAFVLLMALLAGSARAQTCPTGGTASCTLTFHISTTPVQIFTKFSARSYLFLQNTGYTFVNSSVPTVNQNPVFCAIGSNNQAQAESAAGSNVILIQAGGTYEPLQITAPQSSFRVPAGDVSCVAPLGDVWLTAEQE